MTLRYGMILKPRLRNLHNLRISLLARFLGAAVQTQLNINESHGHLTSPH